MKQREWRFYITDMLEFGAKVMSYTGQLTRDEFFSDSIIYEATMWNLRLIGEAATHVPADVQDANPHIQWSQIIGMRHRLTHGYLDFNESVVWTAIDAEVPKLLEDLRELLENVDRSQSSE